MATACEVRDNRLPNSKQDIPDQRDDHRDLISMNSFWIGLVIPYPLHFQIPFFVQAKINII